jgi:Na+/H+ antiporter NhaC
MSQQLIQFTAASIEQAKKSQVKYAWLMLIAIIVLIMSFAGAPTLGLPSVILMIVAGIGWSRWASKIQQRTREHLEAKAAWENAGKGH